jgi:putative DNA primase/helicase
MSATVHSVASDAWIDQARGVPIEDEIRRRGIKLKRQGSELVGPCPRCGGTDRFSINFKKNVWNCRRCKTDADSGDVIGFVQWIDKCDFKAACTRLANEPAPQRPNGKGQSSEPHKVRVRSYQYDDKAGAVVFVVDRFQFQTPDGSFVLTEDGKPQKTFSQRQPDPRGSDSWIWNVEGAPVVPYRLPALIEAVANKRAILIVEGEAKVDLLWSWDMPATCCAGGAEKWRAEHSQYLRGADVVILPDNDAKGRKHADVVAGSLQGIATSIRVLNLPGLPPKGDIIDWVPAGGTVERLHDLIKREAKPWSRNDQQESAADTNQKENEQPITTLESARASTYKMEAIEWLWPNRFARGKVGLLVGLPEEGKGQILCYIAAQVTSPVGRWPCDEGAAPHGNVILLTAEDDPRDTVVPRLAAAGADLDRVEIVKMVRTKNGTRMFSLVTDLELLRKKIIEVGDVQVVQIDPITAYLGHGKIDSFRTTDVRAILAPLVELAAELGVAIIGVMHFNKKTDVTNALLRISDSLAFGATARHVYAAVADAGSKRKLLVRAKNNLAPNNNNTLAYHFSAREVGRDRETEKEIWAPYVIWEPQYVDVTAVEAMQAATQSKSPTARDDAKKFLLDVLANGPVASNEIEEEAKANGISRPTLFRAKRDLNIAAKKDGVRGGWIWQPPEQPTRWDDAA